jgi:hypothetical protein
VHPKLTCANCESSGNRVGWTGQPTRNVPYFLLCDALTLSLITNASPICRYIYLRRLQRIRNLHGRLEVRSGRTSVESTHSEGSRANVFSFGQGDPGKRFFLAYFNLESSEINWNKLEL